MPTKLRRYYGRGDLHFLTFSCYRRLPLLRASEARNLFVNALGEMRARYGFLLMGYVVMPDHVHLLISEPPGSTPSKVLQALKQRVSRDLRRNRPVSGTPRSHLGFSRDELRLPRFWQRRFYDFNVRSVRTTEEKLDYMHANPVKRGLVIDPGEWVWSSYSYYAKGEPGLVAIDAVGRL